jgi:hypothetical protein
MSNQKFANKSLVLLLLSSQNSAPLLGVVQMYYPHTQTYQVSVVNNKDSVLYEAHENQLSMLSFIRIQINSYATFNPNESAFRAPKEEYHFIMELNNNRFEPIERKNTVSRSRQRSRQRSTQKSRPPRA